MDQAISDFAAHLRDRNRSPITVTRYTDMLRRFARFARAELHQDSALPTQIDKALVVLFIREGGVAGSQASATTRNSRLAAIRAFFRFLLAEDRVTRDPTASLHSATLPERAPTFLTADEFTRVRRAVEEHASEYYLRRDLAILVTLWNTGLRVSELLSLDLAVVDFDAEVFRVVRRKGGKLLPVYFNVEVTIALRRWLWQRKEYPKAATDPALFLSDRGRRLSRRAVEDLVAKYAKLAGLEKHVTPHTLRHYAESPVMPSCPPLHAGIARIPGSLTYPTRHNQRLCRKARSLSSGRKRAGRAAVGAVLASARSLSWRLAAK